jgi:hypothetical protein
MAKRITVYEVIWETPERTMKVVRPEKVPMFGEASDGGTFGTAEVEMVAGHLLAFFKKRGHWCEFTINELRDFYRANKWNSNLMFYGLIGTYYRWDGLEMQLHEPEEMLLVASPGGKYFVTNAFIMRCMRNAKKIT